MKRSLNQRFGRPEQERAICSYVLRVRAVGTVPLTTPAYRTFLGCDCGCSTISSTWYVLSYT